MRIYSASIWYHLAFVAISVALLGWGLGALQVTFGSRQAADGVEIAVGFAQLPRHYIYSYQSARVEFENCARVSRMARASVRTLQC
jgi:hypothetical protein